MNWQWTDTLVEPLATRLRGLEWIRVERMKKQPGWVALARVAGEEAGDWYRFGAEVDDLEPFSVLDDPRLPAAAACVERWLERGDSVKLLSHKVGSRAVFLLENAERREVVKIYRKDRGYVDRWRTLRSAAGEPWRVPETLSWDATERRLHVELVPGISLNSKWLRNDGAVEDGDRVSELLSWLTSHPTPTGQARHTTEDEIRILQERLPELSDFVAEPPRDARELVHRVCGALASDPTRDLVTCHRDLHDKQILLDGDVGYLLDLDLLTAGPPALDAGNILAHLRLRALQGTELPWQEIAARIATPLLEAGFQDTLYRWTAASLMRLSLIYSRRHRRRAQLENMFASTREALEQSGEWQDIL